MQAMLERHTRHKLYAVRPCIIYTLQIRDCADIHADIYTYLMLSSVSCSVTNVKVSKLLYCLLQEKVSEADVDPEALGMLIAR